MIAVESKLGVSDLMYVGTSNGRVHKLAVTTDGSNPIIVETLNVFNNDTPVRNLMVVKSETSENEMSDRLIVLSDQEVASVPLFRCDSDKIRSCVECVALQDPHCAWDLVTEECVSNKVFDQKLLQNIQTGINKDCPIIPETMFCSTILLI